MASRPVLVSQLNRGFVARLSSRAQFLSAVWLLFALLVVCGIHGSSTGVTASWWMPEKPYTGYLFNPPTASDPANAASSDGLRTLLMANARRARWDEMTVGTPWALSQFAHQPKFPVINTNFGNGQNMLISPHSPVWHVATLARPATWGYFLLGRQRGLAWYWWFQPFACFTALFLLLEILLGGERRLAAFGAFWFCGSALVVCWSQWPAQVTFFIALGCLCAYHVFASDNRKVRMLCAVLLGLSLPGFLMYMYPVSLVPLSYLFLLIFVGLFVRDKLHRSFRADWRHRSLCLGLAAVIAAGLTAAFVVTCWPDLKVMSNTVYPGRRASVGGDYSLAMLFKGMYNMFTIYNTPVALRNETEAASFYYLFPAVFFAALLSKRLRRNLGLPGLLLMLFILGMLFFLFVGLPEPLARLTLMNYVPSYRADLAIGLASIMLCVYALAIGKRLKRAGDAPKRDAVPGIVAALTTTLLIVHGVLLFKATQEFPPALYILLVALVMGIASYCLIQGNAPTFCLLMSLFVIATTALFNPLATNLDHLYDSELAAQITSINQNSAGRPFWVCYGSTHPGMLVSLLGGRSLTGVQWPPQLALWRALDPDGQHEASYNRYAEVWLEYTADDQLVSFRNPQEGSLFVSVSPTNPALKAMGARYVLVMGDMQKLVDASRLTLISRSAFGNFSIYEIP